MRLRIVIPVLLLGALAIVAALQLSPRRAGGRAGGVPPAAAPKPSGPAASTAPVLAHPLHLPPVPQASVTNSAAAQHLAYVAERCAELEDLAMENKPESLASILGELTNRDPDIRQAAISAAVQFGSRDAIPRLMEAVTQTDDPDEQVALLQAIKFLKLPTLSELTAQARTNTAGSR